MGQATGVSTIGLLIGTTDGAFEGADDGTVEGARDGDAEGEVVRVDVGYVEREREVSTDGDELGLTDGP